MSSYCVFEATTIVAAASTETAVAPTELSEPDGSWLLTLLGKPLLKENLARREIEMRAEALAAEHPDCRIRITTPGGAVHRWMPIEMQPIESSSNIEAIGHNAVSGELRIRFRSGGLYAYEAVPASVVTALRGATSKGAYVHAHIVGKFPHRKLQ